MQSSLSAPKLESMNAIISIVASYYNIPPEKIFEDRRRTEPSASARKIACYLFYELYEKSTSLKMIANHFGRNHTAMLFHHEDVASRLRIYRVGADDKLCEDCYKIQAMLPADLLDRIRQFKPMPKVTERMANIQKQKRAQREGNTRGAKLLSRWQKIDAIYDMLKELSAQNGHSKN